MLEREHPGYAGAVLDLEQLAPETLRPLSRREYEQMVSMGLFEDHERVELLHGMLVKMSPIGSPHAEAVRRLTELLILALHGRASISPQCPLAASDDSEPEPDLAVLPVSEHYAKEHPSEAFLIIEVADSSLNKDRTIKARLYAACGVPEYWIVNLVDGVIEVHTDPQQGRYAEVTSHGRDATIAPCAYPDVQVRVGDVLPG